MPETLMVGVSGIRGIVGKDLTPEIVARYAAAFGSITQTSLDEPSSASLIRQAAEELRQ